MDPHPTSPTHSDPPLQKPPPKPNFGLSQIHEIPNISSNPESPSEVFPADLSFSQEKDLHQAGNLLEKVSIGESASRKENSTEQAKDQMMEEATNQGSYTEAQEVQIQKEAEEPDLTSIMQSLQISIPGEVEVGYQGEEISRPEEASPFRLLMKVASSAGTPRNIPLQALNLSMSKAWGRNYWIIDQVKHATYVAYFRNAEHMDYVLLNQPWSVDGDNLLLQWINPISSDKNIHEYEFKYIYVPIRIYGVPQRYRSPNLMKYVIDKVGHPSDLHPPPELKMEYKQDYISAYAKLEISTPVMDKVRYYVAPNEYILFYINYDKFKRICTFCGMMFHNVQFCPDRRKLILHLQSIGANTTKVPFAHIGLWTTQVAQIPTAAFQQANALGGLSPEFRRIMKVDKSMDSTPYSLSRFIVSSNISEQREMAGKETDLAPGSVIQPGKYLPPPVRLKHAHHQLQNVHGPGSDPQSPLRGHFAHDQHASPKQNASGILPSSQHSGQINLSTHATYKRQQFSEATFSLHRSKRQALVGPAGEEEHDFQFDEGKSRFTSASSTSSHLSAVPSLQPVDSDAVALYRPPHLRYDQGAVNMMDGVLVQKDGQHIQGYEGAYQFNFGGNYTPPESTRKIIHPKRRSRWDVRNMEGIEGNVHNHEEQEAAPTFKAPQAP